MTDDVEITVGLLIRADWTTLCLSAELTTVRNPSVQSILQSPVAVKASQARGNRPDPAAWQAAATADTNFRTSRGRLLVAPGGRYRHTHDVDGTGPILGSDGETAWELGAHDGTDFSDFCPASCQPPARELLCPAWLPSLFELELGGRAEIGGRAALRITARPRPLLRSRSGPGQRGMLTVLPVSWRGPGDELLDRIDAMLDAEFGILLRCERLWDGQLVSRSELARITINPPEAADESQFVPPPRDYYEARGEEEDDDDAEHPQSPFGGPGWRLVKTAANLGASSLGAAIQRKAQAKPRQADAAGSGGWRPDASDGAAVTVSDTAVSLHLIRLLYQAGLRVADLDAELRVWVDTEAALAAMKTAGERWGMSGIGELSDALTELGSQKFQRAVISLGTVGRYRIAYADAAGQRQPRTIAADGKHRWRVFADRTIVGPAAPLPADIGRLFDPAWLLNWKLTGGDEIRLHGRPGFAVRLQESGQPVPPGERDLAEAVIDAELGILLRFSQSVNGKLISLAELNQIRTGQQRSEAEFIVEIPAGTQVIEEGSGPFDWALAPAPVRAAAGLANRVFDAASTVHSLADRLRRG
jgi:hypothetical protein